MDGFSNAGRSVGGLVVSGTPCSEELFKQRVFETDSVL